MSKNQDGAAELGKRLRYLWIHRKGDKTPYAAVMDVIDAEYKNDELKPLLVKQITITDTAFRYLIHLPPGIGYAQFKKKEELFADATGGTVHISKKGKTVIMEILTKELETIYPFSLFHPNEKMALPFPVGMSAKGLISKDLIEFPHFFLGGETNFGKSNQLHVMVNSILLNRPDTQMVVIDPKSTEFAYLEGHALVIDEMNFVGPVFKAVNEIMDKRKKILKKHGCNKIQKYHQKGFNMPYIVIVIDEWADLPEDVQNDLWRLLRMGRFVGIHVIAATQRPSAKTFEKFGDMKAMFYGRMSFVVADELNSRMILDNDRAAHLPAIKGRSIYKCGLDCIEVQCLFLDPDDAAILINSRKGGEIIDISIEQSQKGLPARQSFDLPPRPVQGSDNRTNPVALLPQSPYHSAKTKKVTPI